MQTVSYMGNGTTTEFQFNFPYYDNTNIAVTKNNSSATGYSIVGTSGGTDANIPFVGGKVVFDQAPSTTDSITITRNLPLSRTVDYQPAAKINPTLLNQDMNYILEVLKDFQDDLNLFRTKYKDITNNETAQILLKKIDAVSLAITNLGDISTINSDIATLNNRTNNMSDYVVASQLPTAANNYTWYRKYKSGWVEQGGKCSVAATTAAPGQSATLITFPIPMQCTAQNNYTSLISRTNDPGYTQEVTIRTDAHTSANMYVTYFSTIMPTGALTFDWMAAGMTV